MSFRKQTTMAIDSKLLKNIIEAALLVNGKPQTVKQLMALFEGYDEEPGKKEVQDALNVLSEDYAERGIELKEVASGFRIQARQEMEPWVSRLFQEKAPRYSRALLETLALIAYRQPITRSEIEQVRGVSVSSYIVKTLLEREWVRVVGHKEVPGRPAMYATTREFLDYFNINGIDQLPTLAEIKDLDKMPESLSLPELGSGDASQNSDQHVNGDIVVDVNPADQEVVEKDESVEEDDSANVANISMGELADDDSAVPPGEPIH